MRGEVGMAGKDGGSFGEGWWLSAGGKLELEAQLQNGAIGLEEIVNAKGLAPKELFQHSGRKIAPLDSDHFRRRPKQFRQSNKISIRADYRGYASPASPVENIGIRRVDQSVIID